MTPLLLSKRQAAKLLGVSRTSTLETLIREGHLRTVTVGGSVRISRAELERFAATGCTPRRHRRTAMRPPTPEEFVAEFDRLVR